MEEYLIDEIGSYLGFCMYNKADKTKEYDFVGGREEGCESGDELINGNIIFWKNTSLLVYQYVGFRYLRLKPLYTLNLSTLKPTKNSACQTILSRELLEKIKISKERNKIKRT